MKKNEEFENSSITPDETLKVTSLIYFKEALIHEEYEKCPELVRIAKRFGAGVEDIRGVIAESNQGIRPVPLTQGKVRKGGRRIS